MENTIADQNYPLIYFEPIRNATYEFQSALPVLLNFIATLNSTGSPVELQTLSKLVLKHICSAKTYLNKAKEQMSQLVCEHFERRKQLEDDIQKKEIDLRIKRSSIESKEKECKEKEAKVFEANKKYQAEENKYRMFFQMSESMKVGGVVANTVVAGFGFVFTFATAGFGAPLALVCQSAVAAGSLIAIDAARRARDLAKYDLESSRSDLKEHQKETEELQKKCKNLQTDYINSVQEKTTVDEKYNKVLKLLKETTQFLESVLKCRQFICTLHGETAILQESRKDFRFQLNLRLPLIAICENLRSVIGFDLFDDYEIRRLCTKLNEQVAIIPDSLIEDHNDNIKDYI